jgi:hypothetical protein
MKRYSIILAVAVAIVALFGFARATFAAAPEISDVEVDVGINTATITWTTDITATGKVEYGTVSGTYTNSTTTDSDTLHEVGLYSLIPDTTYYYTITATSADDLVTTVAEASFATQSDTLKMISSKIVVRGPDKIVFRVTTNKSTSVRIKYGTDQNTLNKTAHSNNEYYTGYCGSARNYVLLKNLKPGTTYYYKIVLEQSAFCSGADDEKKAYGVHSIKTTGMPKITSLSKKSGKVGTTVTINGNNFGVGLSKGHTPVDAVVSFGCGLSKWKTYGANIPCLAYIISWTDTKIVARVLKGSLTGPVYIGKAFTEIAAGSNRFDEYTKMFVIKGPTFTVK